LIVPVLWNFLFTLLWLLFFAVFEGGPQKPNPFLLPFFLASFLENRFRYLVLSPFPVMSTFTVIRAAIPFGAREIRVPFSFQKCSSFCVFFPLTGDLKVRPL